LFASACYIFSWRGHHEKMNSSYESSSAFFRVSVWLDVSLLCVGVKTSRHRAHVASAYIHAYKKIEKKNGQKKL